MGSIWGRQDPGGHHVGPINFAIWDQTVEGLQIWALEHITLQCFIMTDQPYIPQHNKLYPNPSHKMHPIPETAYCYFTFNAWDKVELTVYLHRTKKRSSCDTLFWWIAIIHIFPGNTLLIRQTPLSKYRSQCSISVHVLLPNTHQPILVC